VKQLNAVNVAVKQQNAVNVAAIIVCGAFLHGQLTSD
jgi:hypothetical protein